MGNVFESKVVKGGKTTYHTHVIGGSGAMSAEELAVHLEKVNMFPGAESVEITELEGVLETPKLTELRNNRGAVNLRIKQLTTPRATINEKYSVAPGPKYLMPGQAPFAGDRMSHQFNPTEALAAQAGQASSGEEPLKQQGTDSTGPAPSALQSPSKRPEKPAEGR